jgi:hypothetical protein
MNERERALWASVILQAVDDCLGFGVVEKQYRRTQIQRSARLWFLSDCIEPGSFVWICQTIDLEPSWIRRKMRPHLESNRAGKHGRRSSFVTLRDLFADEQAIDCVQDLLSA